MVQPADEAVGDRGHDEADVLAAGLELLRQLQPPLVAPHDAVHGFDQHGPQLRIAGLDHAGVRLAVAAGAVAGRQAAEAGHLLASAEAAVRPISARIVAAVIVQELGRVEIYISN